MNPDELPRIQARLELSSRFPHEEPATRSVQTKVVALGLEGLYVGTPDNANTAFHRDGKTLDVTACSNRLIGGLAAGQWGGRKPLTRARHCFFETRGVVGLQEIIHRVDVKGADRELVERRDENNVRHSLDPLEHSEAVEVGHLHIDESEIDVYRVHRFDGAGSTDALSHDLHVWLALQQPDEAATCHRLVVDDHDTDPLSWHDQQLCGRGCRMASTQGQLA